jgi:hypothetical protein
VNAIVFEYVDGKCDFYNLKLFIDEMAIFDENVVFNVQELGR